MRYRNPFEGEGVWLRANLHTHTTNSDGEESPQDRVTQYAEAGYDVLALTDHRVVTATERLQSGDMLLIPALEAHPVCPDGPLYHLVCLDIGADFAYDEAVPANDVILQVRESGGEVIAAHPYWCGHTVQQLLALDGIIGIEVFNATCAKIGKADSSTIWDYLLATGRSMPAIAVDDTHRGNDIFMGWTMIRAEERTVPAVMKALREGRYYASSGPRIDNLVETEDGLSVTCSPVRAISFICRGSVGRSLTAEEGEALTSATYQVPESAQYVRVQVTDTEGRSAWCNPRWV